MKNAIKREPCKLVCRWPSVSILCNKKTIITALLALIMAPVGVEAKKKVKTVEVPQLVNYPSAELSEYRLHGGNVIIEGRIVIPEEAKGESVPKDVLDKLNGRFTIIMRNYIVGKEKISAIEFKEDGTFSMNVYVPYPMQILVYPLGVAYACPGDTVNVTIDITKRTKEEGLKLDGTGLGGEVTRLWQLIDDKYCKLDWSNKVYEKGLDSLAMWKDEQVAQLDQLVLQMNAGLPELSGCSPLASDILRTHILEEHLQHICDYYMEAEDRNRKDSTINLESYWQQFFSFVAPRASYLTDNPLLMISADEFFFNRLEYYLFRPINRGGIVRFLPFDYAPQLAEMVAKDELPYRRESRMNAMKDIQEKLHLRTTDFTAQVCQLRNVFSTLEMWHKDNYEQAADDVAAAMTVISHPELIRQGILTFREYVKENEIKVIEQKPMTKGDSIFQRIIEPYKGNVLYVDFWEMSCGPCRATMLSMRDEVEANKDKPVKYLYITDNTPEKCKSFLEPNNIKGEHIHITRAEWGYLQEKFNFSGIPFVAIFDKDGNRRDDKTVQQLLEEMK